MTKLLFINKTPFKCILVALLLLFGCDDDNADKDCPWDEAACNYNWVGNSIIPGNLGGICTYPAEDSFGYYIGNNSSGTSENYDCDGNCILDSDCDNICDAVDEFIDDTEDVNFIYLWGQYYNCLLYTSPSPRD